MGNYYMIRSLIVFLLICVGSFAASAKTLQEEMVVFSNWVSEATGTTNALYSIPNYAEDAASLLDAYNQDEITQEDAIEGIADIRTALSGFVQSLKMDVQAIPDMPKLEHFKDMSQIVDRENLTRAVDELEKITIWSIDTTERLVRGEPVDVEENYKSGLTKVKLFANLSDSMITAQRALISNKNHPQLSVLDFMINSNRALVLTEEFYGVLEGYDMQATSGSLLSDMKDVTKRHQKYMSAGKKGQATMVNAFVRQKRFANAEEGKLLDTVISMMNSYDAAWEVEAEFISAMSTFIALASDTDTEHETLNQQLDALSDSLMAFELRRSELIQERVLMMQ